MVKDYGAKGDGITDDTRALQDALDVAGSTDPIGGIVYAPVGVYKISGHLTIPQGVTLSGVAASPMDWVYPHQARYGTILHAYERDTTAAFITMVAPGSCLKGITIYYPEQDVKKVNINVPPLEYPWCIESKWHSESRIENCGSISIIDVMLVNPYKGVHLSEGSSRHYIKNLRGSPLFIGIEIDNCSDVGRIEDVHFWPFAVQGENWENSLGFYSYSLTHSKALILRGTDWQILENFFCYGYETGILLLPTEEGGDVPGPSGHFSNIGCDTCNYGIHAFFIGGINGVYISNYSYAFNKNADNYPIDVHIPNRNAHVRIALGGGENNINQLVLRGGTFWGDYYDGINWACENAELIVSDVVFKYSDFVRRAVGVEKNNHVIISNCIFAPQFSSSDHKALYVATPCEIVVSGCLLAGRWVENVFNNEAQGDFNIRNGDYFKNGAPI